MVKWQAEPGTAASFVEQEVKQVLLCPDEDQAAKAEVHGLVVAESPQVEEADAPVGRTSRGCQWCICFSCMPAGSLNVLHCDSGQRRRRKVRLRPDASRSRRAPAKGISPTTASPVIAMRVRTR